MKPTTDSIDTIAIGNWGEERAVEYLLEEGYRVIERNWRSGRYELDIIAIGKGTLHFVEVKCRRQGGLTTPKEAITANKRDSLFRAAEAYIEESGCELEPQFDLISVEYRGEEYHLQYTPHAILPRW